MTAVERFTRAAVSFVSPRPTSSLPQLPLCAPSQRRCSIMIACALILVLCIAFLALSGAERETFEIWPWLLSSPQLGAPHTRAEYELPDGVQRNTPAADKYYRRWLQCSTVVEWCTPEEVACGCTYEIPGEWSRGSFPWESGAASRAARPTASTHTPRVGTDQGEWLPCQPELPQIYAACPPAVKAAASCVVPRAQKPCNGNCSCVFHKVCSGGGYCHKGLQSTPPEL
jgi:hypothetical protein